MKKLLLSALALALPICAFAQVPSTSAYFQAMPNGSLPQVQSYLNDGSVVFQPLALIDCGSQAIGYTQGHIVCIANSGGGASTPATGTLLKGTGIANGVAAATSTDVVNLIGPNVYDPYNAQIAVSRLLGTLSNTQLPAILTAATTGNAATASAFATTPTLCPAGQAPTGILPNGNATGCSAASGGATTPATTNVLAGSGSANSTQTTSISDTGTAASPTGTVTVSDSGGISVPNGPVAGAGLQSVGTPGTGGISIGYVAGASGTTAMELVSFDTSGNPNTATTAAYAGVAQSTAASGAPVNITATGNAQILFDGAAVVGDIAVPSTTAFGEAHDSGFTSTSQIACTVPVIGKINTSVSGAGVAGYVRLHGTGTFGTACANAVTAGTQYFLSMYGTGGTTLGNSQITTDASGDLNIPGSVSTGATSGVTGADAYVAGTNAANVPTGNSLQFTVPQGSFTNPVDFVADNYNSLQAGGLPVVACSVVTTPTQYLSCIEKHYSLPVCSGSQAITNTGTALVPVFSCITSGNGTVNTNSTAAYGVAYYPTASTAAVSSATPFTGLGYFSTSAAPAAATTAQVRTAAGLQTATVVGNIQMPSNTTGTETASPITCTTNCTSTSPLVSSNYGSLTAPGLGIGVNGFYGNSSTLSAGINSVQALALTSTSLSLKSSNLLFNQSSFTTANNGIGNAVIAGTNVIGINAGTVGNSDGSIAAGHYYGNQSTTLPTLVAGTGSGATPTTTIAVVAGSNDTYGYVTFTPAATPAASATVFTLTFVGPYQKTPACFVLPANSNTQALVGAAGLQSFPANTTTTGFAVTSGTTALAASTAYELYYRCN